MTARLASVDRRPSGDYVVATSSRTLTGGWVNDGPPQLLPASATAADLGTAAIEALRRSRPDAPDITRADTPDAELLAAVGAPSYTAYAKGVRSLEVYAEFDDEPGTIELTPNANGGPRSGFTPIMDEKRDVPADPADQLGRAILDLLEKATA
jgi:hypothetical protein